jgi:hypothetical protein
LFLALCCVINSHKTDIKLWLSARTAVRFHLINKRRIIHINIKQIRRNYKTALTIGFWSASGTTLFALIYIIPQLIIGIDMPNQKTIYSGLLLLAKAVQIDHIMPFKLQLMYIAQ